MKRIAVFCGSRSGANPNHLTAGRKLGETLALRGIGVVYGGAKIGVMGAVADGALSKGGEVIGILPHGLAAREIAHAGLTDLQLVNSMHERKALFEKLSDGFVTLPGGIGTLEELAEIFTWRQLGIHSKPLGLLNVDGFYNHLLSFFQEMIISDFTNAETISKLIIETDIDALLERMQLDTPEPPEKRIWLTRAES